MEKIIQAETHAEFLNKAFGTNYLGWYKSRWNYGSDTWVWMIYIDGKIRRGWKNSFFANGNILEEYVGAGEPTYKNEVERKYRIVVQIIEKNGHREYHILGKYRYDKERSNKRKHIFIKEN